MTKTAETYAEMKQRHQEEVNAFPLRAAFSSEQFSEMMKNWGFGVNDTKQIISIGAGCYIRRSDLQAFKEMTDRQSNEIRQALDEDVTGEEFTYQMFREELANHEYGYTRDLEDTLDAIGLEIETIEKYPALEAGLIKALSEYE